MDTPKNAAWVVRKIIDSREVLINSTSAAGQHLRVPWKSLTLHKHIHPTHRFHLWLAVQQRLSTVDRLQKFGIQVPIECAFCSQEERHSLTFSSHVPIATRYGLDYFIGCTNLEILARGTKSWSGFVTRQSRKIEWLRLCVAPLQ
ncbi:hypothetical protein KY290_024876 [Solanum tuberosum]|uniref:Reverse transcriptase zinc-binding domain-containing protein n=1 Tax=Solanum tuberosum TaxID=4113 RepID=A0ABQ7URW7_SOLTU|nr:hypothetical protein KY284_023729 [Solanum tuberosum]KAH0754606.1 hypothetical protein KY290_024876 [Solanum tuberosum]